MIIHDISLITYHTISSPILLDNQFNLHSLFHVSHLIILQFHQFSRSNPKQLSHCLLLIISTN